MHKIHRHWATQEKFKMHVYVEEIDRYLFSSITLGDISWDPDDKVVSTIRCQRILVHPVGGLSRLLAIVN